MKSLEERSVAEPAQPNHQVMQHTEAQEIEPADTQTSYEVAPLPPWIPPIIPLGPNNQPLAPTVQPRLYLSAMPKTKGTHYSCANIFVLCVAYNCLTQALTHPPPKYFPLIRSYLLSNHNL